MERYDMNLNPLVVLRLIGVVVLSLSVSACEAVGAIFEAGIWVGVIMVVLLVAIGGFVASKLRRRP
jgi:hypothetical protein